MLNVFQKIDGRSVPYLVTGLGAAAIFAVICAIPLTHDVVWQLWIARQLLQGAEIYRDIWEVNPPLWFWSAMPIVKLGDMIGIDPSRLLIALICAMAAVSSILLGKLSGVSGLRKTMLMLLGLWVMLIMPIYDFGQREQLALICGLPYAVLMAQRANETDISRALAVLIGVMAAYGFALKHYFVLVPLLLEAWLFWRMRSGWRPVRPETVILSVSAVVYGICIVAFTPAFFTNIVPMVQTAYTSYDQPWEPVFQRPWICFWGAAVLFFLTYRHAIRSSADTILPPLLIAAAGFGFGYFLQYKGWLYHTVAASGLLAIALYHCLTLRNLRRVAPLLSGVVILCYIVYLPWRTGPYANPLASESEPLLARVPAGQAVHSMAVEPRWIWPSLVHHDLVWASRFYSYWMIPAIGRAEMSGTLSPGLRKLADDIRAETELELRCTRPYLVMIERGRFQSDGSATFDKEQFFLERPDIGRFLSDYYSEGEISPSLRVYWRVKVPPAFHDAACPYRSTAEHH